LGTEVDEITASEGGVRVHTTTGAVEEASHVVVTVPLGVLKAGRPTFSPPLPSGHLTAIANLGFGRFEKVVFRFERAFWRDAGLPHLMLFPRDPQQSTIWAMGLDAFGDAPTLAVFIFHAMAQRLADRTEDETAALILELLGEAIGSPCPPPLEVAVTNWGRDRFSLGSYSHIPPGADPADADLLGEPVGGRVLFAGEHTQSERLVYTDGAMASGLREARRLLGRTEVHIGPLRS
jgi:polyamine oxidase